MVVSGQVVVGRCRAVGNLFASGLSAYILCARILPCIAVHFPFIIRVSTHNTDPAIILPTSTVQLAPWIYLLSIPSTFHLVSANYMPKSASHRILPACLPTKSPESTIASNDCRVTLSNHNRVAASIYHLPGATSTNIFSLLPSH